MINTKMLDPAVLGRSRSAVAPPKDELVHFELCPMCGQAVDRRDIYAVMHHLPVSHAPLPVH